MSRFFFDLQKFALNNYNQNSLISGTSSADIINNYAGGVTIRGGNGNDSIFNSTSSNHTINSNYGYVTIDGGSGKDTIYSYDPRVSISGGAGNDKISLCSSDFSGVTINGGTGNDTIYSDSLGGGVLYQYKKGDGNDIIYGYNARDSITISGSTWTTVNSGNNVLINIANGGRITLAGAKDKNLNINSSKSTSTISPQDVIKKFMKSLDTTNNSGMSALNQAVREASGGYFYNINAAIDQMVTDCQRVNNADTFLRDYCGIILDNEDTGAITGSDAGDSTLKTSSSIVPESGNLHSFTGNSFTVNGVTFQLASFNNAGTPSNLNFSDLTDATQKYIWQALETWWAKSALDLIAQSYGSNYAFASGATVKKIYFGFYDSGTSLGYTSGYFADSSRKIINKLSLRINMNKYNSLIIGDVDGKVSDRSTYYLDRIIAHELTHAIMYANINYADDLPNFIREGMAELTHGADDDRKSEINTLAKNPTKLKHALIYDAYDSYAAGFMFLRYLAKQSSEHYPTSGTSTLVAALQSKSLNASNSVSIKGTLLTLNKNFSSHTLDIADYSSAVKNINATALNDGIMIIGNPNVNSISAGAGNDTVFANISNDIIFGGAGNDILFGEAGNDIINGGEGDDSLYGGTGRDTLIGGDGNDIFVFGINAGSDVITDYTPAQDKIKLVEGSVVSYIVNGNDVVFNLGRSNSVKIKGAKNKNITIIDKNDKETTKKYGEPTLQVTNSTSSPVTVSSSIKIIKAATRTSAVKITGNALANSIIGGAGNDTLYGGDGNDSITGGEGNDKIFGNDGNDKLYGNDGTDTLSGAKGNDTIYGGADNDSLNGGDGDDVLRGETGNDILTGGTGNDLFIYSEGNDIISDYATGDRISLGADYSKITVKSSDVVFSFGDDSLTVKNGAGKILTLVDSLSNVSTLKSGSAKSNSKTSTSLTITDSDKATVTASSVVKTINASKRTKAIKITGNALANTIKSGAGNDSLYGGKGNDSIVGGKGDDRIFGNDGNDKLFGNAGDDIMRGGAGNDTLQGAKGNDSLWGDAGADTFIYAAGDGQDIIYGFDNNDMLQITGSFSTSYNGSKLEIYFKVGTMDNAITLKNYTATSFNVNGDTYRISGNKFIK